MIFLFLFVVLFFSSHTGYFKYATFQCWVQWHYVDFPVMDINHLHLEEQCGNVMILTCLFLRLVEVLVAVTIQIGLPEPKNPRYSPSHPSGRMLLRRELLKLSLVSALPSPPKLILLSDLYLTLAQSVPGPFCLFQVPLKKLHLDQRTQRIGEASWNSKKNDFIAVRTKINEFLRKTFCCTYFIYLGLHSVCNSQFGILFTL